MSPLSPNLKDSHKNGYRSGTSKISLSLKGGSFRERKIRKRNLATQFLCFLWIENLFCKSKLLSYQLKQIGLENIVWTLGFETVTKNATGHEKFSVSKWGDNSHKQNSYSFFFFITLNFYFKEKKGRQEGPTPITKATNE